MNIINFEKQKHGKQPLFFVFLWLICFFTILPVAAQTIKDKNITLKTQNESLIIVLNKISTLTNYKFFYDQETIDRAPHVSINAKNTTIQSLLDQIAAQTGLQFHKTDNTISVSKTPPAAQKQQETDRIVTTKTVTGKIIDEKGEPVIGANVIEKGTPNNGTVTDVDGNFSIEIPANATLQISYIGYLPQDVTTVAGKNLNITLKEDTKTLDELVVVGYGTMKKSDLMGATSTLSGDNLTINSNISVGEAFQGKMSGISILSNSGFPGTETSVSIRGIGTFGSGDNKPLIIIDGSPVSSGLESLNPGDIESVNVLKDASSAAIYGSRAANGVILITTKMGKEGKSKLMVNTTYGIQQPSHIMEILDATEFVSAILEMRDNKKAIDGGDPTTKYDGLDPASFGSGTRWSDYIYKTAPTYNLNASISGGSKTSRYYLSGEYLNQDGIGLNTSFQKASFRANVEGNFGKFLTVGNNTQLAYRYTQGDKDNRLSDVIFNAPVTPAFDQDGSYGEPDSRFTSSKNAIAEAGWQYPTNNNYRLLDNMFVEFKFTEFLKFRFNGGVDIGFNEYKLFSPIYNDGGQTNNTNSYTEERAKDLMWVTDYLLYFDKNFTGGHTINAMGGVSQQLYTTDNMYGKVKDFVSEVSNMQVLNGGTNSTDKTITGGKNELALGSYFGRINYDYQGRYLFGFNIRADGSSRFKGSNQWGVFPSFSGAWRISEEQFFKSNIISNLKLRASWGQLGNQSIGSWYPTIASVSKKNVIFGTKEITQALYSGYSQSSLSNKNLKWETTTVTNVGIDIGLFSGRLAITADAFLKNTDGILRSMVLPPSVGMGAPNVNYAKVQNKGIDLEVNYNGNVNDFKYGISGNISFLNNKILKLSSGVDEEITTLPYGGASINKVGWPVASLYGYKTGDVITSKEEADKLKKMGQGNAKIGRLQYIDTNNDGKITGADRVFLGSYIPKVQTGLTLSAEWKNIDFNSVFSGVFGRRQHSPMSFQNRFPNRNASRKWYDNRWTSGTDPAGKYPAMIQAESYEEMTDLMTSNTSFVKLKSLTLGYRHQFEAVAARIFLSGENLLTFTTKEFDGFDPENGNAVGHYTNWGGDYPTARILLVGLSLSF
ncbi:MAG: hypothetical protein BGO33_03545 [Bacteroidia bacterium 43-41]|nr:MAG: hypothetical protein BGO33_03545 [Bacteroidia bacterium 43-41]